jgi:hypothetical protein
VESVEHHRTPLLARADLLSVAKSTRSSCGRPAFNAHASRKSAKNLRRYGSFSTDAEVCHTSAQETTVKAVRALSIGRSRPWTDDELMKLAAACKP